MINLSFPTVKLGDHIRKISLKVKDSEYDVSDITVFGVTNTEGITITGQKISDNIDNYILLKDNQFAYNPYRVNVGSLGLFKGNDIGAVSPAYVVFETLETYDSHFLLFYLKSRLGLKLIKWYGDRGGVRAALRYDDLCKIDVPDISVDKQRQLMQNFSFVNQRVAEYNHQIEKQIRYIAKLRRSILRQAVEGKLCEQNPSDESASELLKLVKAKKQQLINEGNIRNEKPLPPITKEEKAFDLPSGWVWCRLLDIIKEPPKNGYSAKRVNHNTNKKVLTLTATTSGKFLEDAFKYIDEDIPSDSYLWLNQGDILIQRSNSFEYVGTACVVDHEVKGYIYPDLMMKIQLIQENMATYVLLSLQSCYSRQYYQSLATGTSPSMRKINQSIVENTVIPLPPLDEQKRIVMKVNKLMAYCDELEKQVNESKTSAEKLVQSVLAKAFNAESRKKSVAKIITIASQIQSQPIKIAARGSILGETMKHIEQTIDDMCGDS